MELKSLWACGRRVRDGKVAQIMEGAPCLHGDCPWGRLGRVPGLCHLSMQLRWSGHGWEGMGEVRRR